MENIRNPDGNHNNSRDKQSLDDSHIYAVYISQNATNKKKGTVIDLLIDQYDIDPAVTNRYYLA